jgi:RND family efflux transporter MFP subunit
MLKIVLPLVVLLSSLTGAWALVALRPPTPSQPPHSEPPLVQTVRLEPQTLRLAVRSQGVATPRNEIDLVAQVAGQVTKLHPSLAAGGFFEAGEVLMAVDPRDYDLAIEEAEARIAEARRQVATEEAQAEQARSEWQALGEGRPTPLTLHEPQLAEARARLKAAEADRAKARLQRSRCEWRAPFAGRVREKKVGLGQYVRPGDALARIYATDAAEVRLPLSKDQLASLDLPLGSRDSRLRAGPRVVLSTDFAATPRRWEGRIVRVEGALDEATGLLHVVAEVRDPYAAKDGQPPLMAGLFVQAEIEGKAQAGLFVLPPGAVNAAQESLWVDGENRLRIRRLDIVQNEPERVVAKGLPAGGRLVVSGVQVPVEGMAVRPQESLPR